LQAYVGLGHMYLVGLSLPHSGTECMTVNLEQSNLVLHYSNVGLPVYLIGMYRQHIYNL